eukprot:m.165324 g.165324  ORF g.165324 m.165324 type:complete len:169 (-) comp12548_c0_seq1:124-630(-)
MWYRIATRTVGNVLRSPLHTARTASTRAACATTQSLHTHHVGLVTRPPGLVMGSLRGAWQAPRTVGYRSGARSMSSEAFNIDDSLRDLADTFAEARLELEDCADAVGTTYFESDLEICIEIVKEVRSIYDKIIENASESEVKRVKESWGLKLAQLDGELHNLLEEHDH